MKGSFDNDLLLRALNREPVERTPVWLMRQAGRYLPEYRATRARAGDFLTLCKTPELACEVTLQPLARYPLDAAILFSDILTIPDAMGLGLSLEEGEGPRFARPLRTPADVDRLGAPDPEVETAYVMDAVRTISAALNRSVPLIGFAGSPWTLAAYMIEGRSSPDFKLAKAFMLNEPQAMMRLAHLLSDSIASYLNAQVQAGADALMIFDSWGGMLSPKDYRQFSLEPIERIVAALAREHEGRKIPITVFSKGANASLEAIATCGCDAVGLDWTIDIGAARRLIGDRVALQGNLDPAVLYAKPERIREEVGKVLEGFGEGNGHVFNLGHGLQPGMDPEHVGACVQAVRELSAVGLEP